MSNAYTYACVCVCVDFCWYCVHRWLLPSLFHVSSNSLNWNNEQPTTIGLTKVIWGKMHVYRCAHTTVNKLISSPFAIREQRDWQMDRQIYSLDTPTTFMVFRTAICLFIFSVLIFHQRFCRLSRKKKSREKITNLCAYSWINDQSYL